MTKPIVHVQWKGTEACLDFVCSCGHDGHFDGYFASPIICPGCGLAWDIIAELKPHD